MDDKKFCFIMCTNNPQYEAEALHFIGKLHVPDGYTVDAISIKDAVSLTAGYNEGMQASDAKYKIYLHQDVMIIHPEFLTDILRIFTDATIGMIGMVGTPHLPESLIPWDTDRLGTIYSSNVSAVATLELEDYVKPKPGYAVVEAIDGLLIATQYDIPWREDVFDKWDFYDVSQSIEFQKKGYQVAVPYMEKPWVIHDDGFCNLTHYYEEREKAVALYGKDLNWRR